MRNTQQRRKTMVRKITHKQTTTRKLHMNEFLVCIEDLLIFKCITVNPFLVDVTLFLQVYGEDKCGDLRVGIL